MYQTRKNVQNKNKKAKKIFTIGDKTKYGNILQHTPHMLQIIYKEMHKKRNW